MRWVLCGMMLAGAMWVSLAAGQQSEEGPSSKILALENAWDRAIESKDVGVLDTLFDNALVYVEYDGRLMTKAEVLAEVRAGKSHSLRIMTQPTMVRVFGTTAIVLETYQEKGIENGKAYERRGRFIDTWIFKNGRWVCVAAQTTLLMR